MTRVIQTYKKKCIQCDRAGLIDLIDLGNSPWCNDFKKKPVKKYKLKVLICKYCSGAQLDFVISKEKMFIKNYYLSSDNKELINHFNSISKKIKSLYQLKKKHQRSILDIGSNDGAFLNFFKNDWQILGVDPSITASKLANSKGIKTLKNFFNYSLAKKISTNFDVIHASGVFFHVEELISLIKGVKILLKTRGSLIIQFIYLNDLIKNYRFDQIYHEHLYYYNLKSLKILLDRFDLEIFDAEKSKIHGGSMIAYVAHKGLKEKTKRFLNLERFEDKEKNIFWQKVNKFQIEINQIKKNFQTKVNKYLSRGKKIFILGVPAKGTTVANFFDFNQYRFGSAYDINKLKIGNNIPGTKIKILSEDKLKKEKINKKNVFLILSWNYKKTILKKLRKKFGKDLNYFFPYNTR